MYWVEGIEVINKATIENEKEQVWDLYITLYPNMTKESYISFEDFYEEFSRQSVVVSTKTKEEIVNEVAEIRRKAR